jgi:hypothetical protein
MAGWAIIPGLPSPVEGVCSLTDDLSLLNMKATLFYICVTHSLIQRLSVHSNHN